MRLRRDTTSTTHVHPPCGVCARVRAWANGERENNRVGMRGSIYSRKQTVALKLGEEATRRRPHGGARSLLRGLVKHVRQLRSRGAELERTRGTGIEHTYIYARVSSRGKRRITVVDEIGRRGKLSARTARS